MHNSAQKINKSRADEITGDLQDRIVVVEKVKFPNAKKRQRCHTSNRRREINRNYEIARFLPGLEIGGESHSFIET
jgi:hypothetical protein